MSDTLTNTAQGTATKKPWWTSKTILSLLPIILSAIFGDSIQDEDVRNLTKAASVIATSAGVIYGRRKAKGGLSL